MNTLELFCMYGFVFLRLSVDALRKWPLASRPRVLPTLWLVYYGAMLAACAWMLPFLATHPAYIQPLQEYAPTWLVWTLTVFAALLILFTLLELGEKAYSLMRRPTHQR